MDQQTYFDPLGQRQVDPEVFRRVWNRVMPDQRDSPIAVEPPSVPAHPAPLKRPDFVSPAAASPEAPSDAPSMGAAGEASSDARALRERMDQLWEGTARAQALARRGGSEARALAGLASDHRQLMSRLSAAYFLTTGESYQPRGKAPAGSPSRSIALRELFLWERQWVLDCQTAAQESGDPVLRELYQELARDGALHARAIRGLVERMWGKGLDEGRPRG